MTLDDLTIAARTVYGEARGESYESKKAVAHVILNRVRLRRAGPDHTVAAACLRAKQFSCWNRDDPNREVLLKAGLDEAMFRSSLRAVLDAHDEPDPTHGATHYHTRAVAPFWAAGKTPCAAIGAHVFYNDVA